MAWKKSVVREMDGQPWEGEKDHKYRYYLIVLRDSAGEVICCDLQKTCSKCGKMMDAQKAMLDKTECGEPQRPRPSVLDDGEPIEVCFSDVPPVYVPVTALSHLRNTR